MKFKSIFIVTLLVLSGFVVGCASEPSEADIRKALNNNLAQTMGAMGGAANMFGKSEIHSVKKIGCKEASDSTGYYCDFEIDMTAPLVGRQKGVGKSLFVKAKDGWVVVNH